MGTHDTESEGQSSRPILSDRSILSFNSYSIPLYASVGILTSRCRSTRKWALCISKRSRRSRNWVTRRANTTFIGRWRSRTDLLDML